MRNLGWWAIGLVLACAGATPPSVTRAVPVGTLRVGTSGDYSPFSMQNGDAEAREGFDIEVAKAMARDLHLEIEWVPFQWRELQQAVRNDHFDIAMSGITWRPTRAVLGWMSQAVATGGPCLLGEPSAPKLAVNHGGALEAWARRALPDRELVPVDDNLELPELLASGQVGALVTDSFELSSFRSVPGASDSWQSQCEEPTWRKVYWVAPSKVLELAPRIETWLLEHEAEVQRARERWFGKVPSPGPFSRLEDLLARRLALMPHVLAYKKEHSLPVEDLAREAKVLASAATSAAKHQVNRQSLGALFQLQMTLAKNVQKRAKSVAALDLSSQLRPLLLRLGDRIVLELSRLEAQGQLARITARDLGLLSSWLQPQEQEELAVTLRGPWSP